MRYIAFGVLHANTLGQHVVCEVAPLPSSMYPNAFSKRRGEKRAIATLMASDEVANPDVLLDDLKILAELPDDSMHTNAEDNAAFVVHKMVEEFKSRQDLRDKLELLQSDRDAIQVLSTCSQFFVCMQYLGIWYLYQ